MSSLSLFGRSWSNSCARQIGNDAGVLSIAHFRVIMRGEHSCCALLRYVTKFITEARNVVNSHSDMNGSLSIIIFFTSYILEALGLTRNKLTLNKHFSRLHFPSLSFIYHIKKVIILLLCAKGVQNSLASAQKGVFMVFGNTVEASIEGALLIVKNGAETQTLFHL